MDVVCWRPEERLAHGVQVLIRWAVQRSTSVLPKSTDSERIASNLAVLDWSLTDADMAVLSLDYQARMVDGSFLLSPAGPYRCDNNVLEHIVTTLTLLRCDTGL